MEAKIKNTDNSVFAGMDLNDQFMAQKIFLKHVDQCLVGVDEHSIAYKSALVAFNNGFRFGQEYENKIRKELMLKYKCLIQVGEKTIELNLEAMNEDAAIEVACRTAEYAGGDFTDIIYVRLA